MINIVNSALRRKRAPQLHRFTHTTSAAQEISVGKRSAHAKLRRIGERVDDRVRRVTAFHADRRKCNEMLNEFLTQRFTALASFKRELRCAG